MKKFFVYFSLFLSILILVIVFKSQLFWIHGEKNLIDQYRRELTGLGQASLKSRDMPISAVLIHNFKIIGRGYNSVVRDSSAGSHAVINAITDGIRTFGLRSFMNLNRDSLKIIATYEPCEMCKGALIEYKIYNIEFLRSKSFSDIMGDSWEEFQYNLNKQLLEGQAVQDSLFHLHPAYKSELPDF